MKLRSLEHFGVSGPKLAAVAVSAGTLGALGFQFLVGSSLGGATPEFELLTAAVVAYIVATTPKRIMSAAATSQAHESVVLSAAAVACMLVTKSRSATFLMLNSEDGEMRDVLREVKRGLLLGGGVEDLARRAGGRLASYSAAGVLASVATMHPDRPTEGGEEASGLDESAELALETKLPVFMAVCFFTPIMLLLYSLFGHLTDVVALAGLVGFEVVVLDLAYFLCNSGRGKES